jgi:hypothetical protein
VFDDEYNFEDDYDTDFMREIDQIEQDATLKDRNGAYYCSELTRR